MKGWFKLSSFRTHTCGELRLADIGKEDIVDFSSRILIKSSVCVWGMVRMSAPGKVTREQLKDVHIKLDI